MVVELVDIAFVPEAFVVPANTDVRVTLTNTGATVHDFTIEELGIVEVLDPGGETTVTINADAGEYEYICTQPGHFEAGMVGTLTATGEAPTVTPSPDPAAESTSGVLFETAVTVFPDPPATFFLSALTLAPGAELASLAEVGPIGFFAVAGDLTIERPERLPARLPEGRGVAFPAGGDLRVLNGGPDPVVALVAGVMSTGASFGAAPPATSPVASAPTARPEPILPRPPTTAPPTPRTTLTPALPAAPTSAPTATAELAESDQPISIRGTGTTVSDRFRLAAGRYKVTARLEVDGFSGFIAVVHGDGGRSELLFNELIDDTGTWTASTIVDVERGGTFFVEVSNTDAPWSLRFEEF